MRRLLAASALLLTLFGTTSSDARITCGRRATVKVGGYVASAIGSKQSEGHRLPPEVIQRVVRANFGKFRACYENGLRNCPNLQGRVIVRFVIQPNGTVTHVSTKDSDLPDVAVARCVGEKFKELVFPAFKGPPIKVSYPVMFSPGG